MQQQLTAQLGEEKLDLVDASASISLDNYRNKEKCVCIICYLCIPLNKVPGYPQHVGVLCQLQKILLQLFFIFGYFP